MHRAPHSLHIAVLGSTYARSAGDAQVPWLRESVNRLAARGHRVTVIAPSFEGLRTHRIDGVEVRRFRYAPRRWENLTHDEGAPNKLRNPLYQLLAAPYIALGALATTRWARQQRFDVIHCHWPFPHGLMALPAARLSGAKVVAMCHGAELAMARRRPWIRALLRQCLLRSDVLACNSSHTQSEIERLCGRRATVIPYGATLREPAAAPERLPGDTATLLFTGRHIQRKGVPFLLRALPAILERRRVKLLITGDGDRRGEWEVLARELHLGDAVQFLGTVSNDELSRLYRACDVFVLPAIFDDRGDTEGLGVVLIEALQNARPVVASAVGGITDVIQHEKTGLLVPEKDPFALAAAVLRLLDEPTLACRLGETGRDEAARLFDWDRITSATEQLYARALRGTPAPAFVPAAAISTNP
ncbi:MAG: glycosyltransferase family 4 protein [Chthoniobacter sp.]|nr:glycosyltransferase family 4 protein [Chthoniobacter sp.]